MKRLWKFELTLEDGQTLYVGADGNPDSASMFAAEEDAAKQEATRRVFEFEKVYGVTPASVRYESHGKANADAHLGKPMRQLRNRRHALRLTLEQVARRAELSKGFLSLVENGKTRLGLDTAVRPHPNPSPFISKDSTVCHRLLGIV